jgi:transposase
MWFIHKLTPDFKTTADFRKYSASTIKSLFQNFNLFLKERGLFKSHDIAIDRTEM